MSEKEGRKDSSKTESKKKASGQLSEDELRAAIDKIFEEYDKDKSGALDKHEVANLMTKSLGRSRLSDKEVEDFMKRIDNDGSNTLDRNELFRLYKQLYC